ncbi:MAG TPA: cytochrome P450 [Acidimicrobiales bacterium]
MAANDTAANDTAANDTAADPFERFNRAMGLGVRQTPYPDMALAREVTPVVEGDIAVAVHGPGALDTEIVDPAGAERSFTPLTFDSNMAVLKDGETFSSTVYAEVMGAVMGHTILEMDEPEHGSYRRLIQQAFTRKAMDGKEEELVVPIVDELIDAFVDRGRAELVSELLFPFPVNVIAGLLGLPREDLPMFHRLSVELIGITIDWDAGMAAAAALRDYFVGVVEDRRRSPRNDMISILVQAEVDGHQLTDDEIVAFLKLLLPAGAETTYRSSSNLMCGLLTHPEQLKAVIDDPGLIPQAIEEGLRWEAPLLTILRRTTRQTILEGVTLPEGATIVLNLGAANHDPTRWDRPDEFDIFRPAIPHLAFASGPHMCLGMHLARMETRAALSRLFDRLPGLRLDPSADEPYITGLLFRAPPRLDVVWG